jgi:hypothetical protein
VEVVVSDLEQQLAELLREVVEEDLMSYGLTIDEVCRKFPTVSPSVFTNDLRRLRRAAMLLKELKL